MRVVSVKSSPGFLIRQLNYIPYRSRFGYHSRRMSMSLKTSFYTLKNGQKLIQSEKHLSCGKVFFDCSEKYEGMGQIGGNLNKVEQLDECQKQQILKNSGKGLNCGNQELESQKKIEQNENETIEYYENHQDLGKVEDELRIGNVMRDENNKAEILKLDKDSDKLEGMEIVKKGIVKERTDKKIQQNKLLGRLLNKNKKVVKFKEEISNPQQKQDKQINKVSMIKQRKLEDDKFNEILKQLKQNTKQKRELLQVNKKMKQNDQKGSNKFLKRFKKKSQ